MRLLNRRSRDRLLYGRPRRTAEEPVSLSRPPKVPASIDLVYEVAQTKLREQLASIDQLDTKAGVLVGALVAASGAFLATAKLPDWAKPTFAAILILSILVAVGAFLVRLYEDAPDPEDFSRYGSLEPGEVKTLTLRDLLSAWVLNERKVVLKGRLINFSLLLASLGVIVAVIARAAS